MDMENLKNRLGQLSDKLEGAFATFLERPKLFWGSVSLIFVTGVSLSVATIRDSATIIHDSNQSIQVSEEYIKDYQAQVQGYNRASDDYRESAEIYRRNEQTNSESIAILCSLFGPNETDPSVIAICKQ
jgi:hypothetical protein